MKITGYYMDCMVIMPDKQVKDIVCLDCATKAEAMAKIKSVDRLAGGKMAFCERHKLDVQGVAFTVSLGDAVRPYLPTADYYL